MKIQSVEDAIRILEENARIQAETFETGNYKLGNKCFKIYSKCIVYLYEHNSLELLSPLLESDDVGVRSVAAYALLPIQERKCITVLTKICNGNYGINSLHAEMTIKLWKKKEIVFPYESGFHW